MNKLQLFGKQTLTTGNPCQQPQTSPLLPAQRSQVLMQTLENFVDDLRFFDAAMPARNDGFSACVEVRVFVGDDSVAAFQ